MNIVSTKDFIQTQFSKIIEDVAEEIAQEAAYAAAKKARSRVREAFASYAVNTGMFVNAEFNGAEVRLTIKIPDLLLKEGPQAIMKALFGGEK